jgi:two-component sensor histidine kinase
LIRFRTRDDQCTLTISDNGRGLAAPFKTQGIGTKLLKALAQQMGARVRVFNRKGLTYSFVFRVAA